MSLSASKILALGLFVACGVCLYVFVGSEGVSTAGHMELEQKWRSNKVIDIETLGVSRGDTRDELLASAETHGFIIAEVRISSPGLGPAPEECSLELKSETFRFEKKSANENGEPVTLVWGAVVGLDRFHIRCREGVVKMTDINVILDDSAT